MKTKSMTKNNVLKKMPPVRELRKFHSEPQNEVDHNLPLSKLATLLAVLIATVTAVQLASAFARRRFRRIPRLLNAREMDAHPQA